MNKFAEAKTVPVVVATKNKNKIINIKVALRSINFHVVRVNEQY